MFKELNPLLHSELRLAVMSLLVSVEEADFVYIRQQTGATAGNLSVQIDKLNKAGYVEVTKTFKGKASDTRRPRPICRRTGVSSGYGRRLKEGHRRYSRTVRSEEHTSELQSRE